MLCCKLEDMSILKHTRYVGVHNFFRQVNKLCVKSWGPLIIENHFCVALMANRIVVLSATQNPI